MSASSNPVWSPPRASGDLIGTVLAPQLVFRLEIGDCDAFGMVVSGHVISLEVPNAAMMASLAASASSFVWKMTFLSKASCGISGHTSIT